MCVSVYVLIKLLLKKLEELNVCLRIVRLIIMSRKGPHKNSKMCVCVSVCSISAHYY